MQVLLRLDGRSPKGSALICHNERLADPLDPFARAIKEVSGKRKKTDADHVDMAHLEFLGGLYANPPLTWPLNGSSNAVPSLPAWNVLRCLQDGGRRNKRGVDVPRGIYPLAEFAAIQYDGPADPEKLWQQRDVFALRKSVGVQRARTMRTRPIFAEWQSELLIEVDANVFNLDDLRLIWRDAGIYAGIGDMRPVYGRFIGTIEES